MGSSEPSTSPSGAPSNAPNDIPSSAPSTAPSSEPTKAPGTDGCASCDLVPCGYCQEGCAPSSCTYESQLDKPGKADRNGCGISNGIWNQGSVPPNCRPSSPIVAPTSEPTITPAAPNKAPTKAPISGPPGSCASCDLVPCGYCQEGCAPSSCTYESPVDKSSSTDRNGCGINNGIWNQGSVPPNCRTGPPPPPPPNSESSGTGSCASCDLVPCEYCQEGCAPSSCTYESELD